VGCVFFFSFFSVFFVFFWGGGGGGGGACSDRGIGTSASAIIGSIQCALAWGRSVSCARFALRHRGIVSSASGDLPSNLSVFVRGLGRRSDTSLLRGTLHWAERVNRGRGIDLILTTAHSRSPPPLPSRRHDHLGFDGRGATGRGVSRRQHCHAGFAPSPRRSSMAAPPGALRSDYAAIPYTKLRRPYWPRHALAVLNLTPSIATLRRGTKVGASGRCQSTI